MSKTLVVRFYGRFLFVDSFPEPGNLTVLAVNMLKNLKEVHANRHDVLLTIPESNYGGTGQNDDLFEASARIMAKDERVQDGQHLWFITACKIKVPGEGGVRWKKAAKLADLTDLASDGRLDTKKYVNVFPNPGVTAIISLQSGVATAYQMTEDSDQQYDYVWYSDQKNKVPNKGPDRLADMVEVRVELADDKLELEVEGIGRPPRIKVERTEGSHATKSSEMLLTFSNLCARSEQGNVDTEFAAFYELLVQPPGRRPIPRAKVEKDFRPIGGDCFLAATVLV